MPARSTSMNATLRSLVPRPGTSHGCDRPRPRPARASATRWRSRATGSRSESPARTIPAAPRAASPRAPCTSRDAWAAPGRSRHPCARPRAMVAGSVPASRSRARTWSRARPWRATPPRAHAPAPPCTSNAATEHGRSGACSACPGFPPAPGSARPSRCPTARWRSAPPATTAMARTRAPHSSARCAAGGWRASTPRAPPRARASAQGSPSARRPAGRRRVRGDSLPWHRTWTPRSRPSPERWNSSATASRSPCCLRVPHPARRCRPRRRRQCRRPHHPPRRTPHPRSRGPRPPSPSRPTRR